MNSAYSCPPTHTASHMPLRRPQRAAMMEDNSKPHTSQQNKRDPLANYQLCFIRLTLPLVVHLIFSNTVLPSESRSLYITDGVRGKNYGMRIRHVGSASAPQIEASDFTFVKKTS